VSQQFPARTEIVIAAHSIYSRDLALSVFYVVGHVKGWLRGESFETRSRDVNLSVFVDSVCLQAGQLSGGDGLRSVNCRSIVSVRERDIDGVAKGPLRVAKGYDTGTRYGMSDLPAIEMQGITEICWRFLRMP
jgi:hypothetical protein